MHPPLRMPSDFVRDLSLKLHLAFVGCTCQSDNQYLLNQLVFMTYVSYFLWRDGLGEVDGELFHRAGGAFDSAATRARHTGVWRLDGDEKAPVCDVLLFHDQQMLAAPKQCYLDAKDRLDDLLAAGRFLSKP